MWGADYHGKYGEISIAQKCDSWRHKQSQTNAKCNCAQPHTSNADVMYKHHMQHKKLWRFTLVCIRSLGFIFDVDFLTPRPLLGYLVIEEKY